MDNFNQQNSYIPNPAELENSGIDREELETLKKKYIGTPGMNPNKIPEHQQWIVHHAVDEQEQLSLLRAWDSYRKTGNDSEFSSKYNSLQTDKLGEFGGLVGEAAFNASAVIGGIGLARGAASLGKSAYSGLKGLFKSEASQSMKMRGAKSTEGVFKSGSDNWANLTKKTETPFKTPTQQPKSTFGEKVGPGGTFKGSSARVPGSTRGTTADTISKGSFFGKMGNFVGKTFNAIGNVAAIAGTGLAAGLGTMFGGNNSGAGASSAIQPIHGEVSAVEPDFKSEITSHVSGGDLGQTGESTFGSSSDISGKSVGEILIKIYSATVQNKEILQQISKNTRQSASLLAKADEESDLSGVNVAARAGHLHQASAVYGGGHGEGGYEEDKSGGLFSNLMKDENGKTTAVGKLVSLGGKALKGIGKGIGKGVAVLGAGALASHLKGDKSITDLMDLKPEGTGITPNKRSLEAMEFFQSKGWSKEQAAGIVGNLQQESGNFSDDVLTGKSRGDKGSAVGVAQWRGDRQKKFEELYGKKIENASLQEQLAFVDWELRNSHKGAGDRLTEAPNAGTAAAIVDKYYEVSAGTERGRRMANAERLLNPDQKLNVIKPNKAGSENKNSRPRNIVGESGVVNITPSQPSQSGDQNKAVRHKNEYLDETGNQHVSVDEHGKRTTTSAAVPVSAGIVDKITSKGSDALKKTEDYLFGDKNSFLPTRDQLNEFGVDIAEGSNVEVLESSRLAVPEISEVKPIIIGDSEKSEQEENIIPESELFKAKEVTLENSGTASALKPSNEELIQNRQEMMEHAKEKGLIAANEAESGLEAGTGRQLSDDEIEAKKFEAQARLTQAQQMQKERDEFKEKAVQSASPVNRTGDTEFQSPEESMKNIEKDIGVSPVNEPTLSLEEAQSKIPNTQSDAEVMAQSMKNLSSFAAKQQPPQQAPSSGNPSSSGKSGKMMKVRDDDPVILQIQYGNIRTV